MAFWGIEIKPGKPYTHVYDAAHGRLHISQAVLGSGSGSKKCIVKCNVGKGNPVFICSLLPDKSESCPLDLDFEEDDEVIFSVDGPRSVHLTGYYLGPSGGSDQEGDDADSYGEDDAEAEAEEESTDYDTEDEYDVDFADDSDFEIFPSSSQPASGVRIEEIIDDEKPEDGNSIKKYPKKVNQLSDPEEEEDDDDDDDGSQHQIVVRGTSGRVVESEDEDGFPFTLTSKGKATSKNVTASENSDTQTTAASKKEKEKMKKKKKQQEDHSDQVTGLKRKIDAIDEDGEPESGVKELGDGSETSGGAVAEKGGKSKKKKKEKIEKKIAQVNGSNLETSTTSSDHNGTTDGKKVGASIDEQPQSGNLTTDCMDHDVPVEENPKEGLPNDESPVVNAAADESSVKKKKKKKKKKNKKSKVDENDAAGMMGQDSGPDKPMINPEENPSKEKDKVEVQPSKVRTFSNGLVIEELSMGKPDGKRASPGNRVSVHYIGRLKKNGQIFDSNIGQRPFRFRLGIGQVIKGWDVGVAGMRIGDKRRFTIPPSMGYGSKGVGKIPANSWLVFDVELVDVM